jgi:protein TilB
MKTGYTKEVRKEMYEKMYEDKIRKEKDRNPEKFVEEKLSPMFNEKGEIRQCNEGRFKFLLK